jgi:hypothetical protein
VINISDPSNPNTPIYENTTGRSEDVYVSGDYAYIADGNSGLAVINISDPTNPGAPVYENTNGWANRIHVSGDYAYIADGPSGLAVIDISDPTSPGAPAYEDTIGYAVDVFVSGDYVYVADYEQGLAVIDISNPTNPGTPVYENTTSYAEGVFVSGDHAFVADRISGLAVIDISDPTNPGTPNYESVIGLANGVFVSGDYAYLADGTSGLAVIRVRITDLLEPSIDSSHTPLSPHELDTVTVTATVTDSSGVAQVILSYSTDGQSTWTNATMTFQSGDDWTATIPLQATNTTVDYKVYARDIVGNWATSTTDSYLVGNSDTAGPLLVIDITPSFPTDADDVAVTATVTDSNGVAVVELSYSTDGQTTWTNVTMVYQSGNDWTATIPSQPAETDVYYKVYARDYVGNWATSSVVYYTVTSSSATTTTTTPTTTTTSTTTATTTPTNGPQPDPTMTALVTGGGAAVVALVAALFILRRRKPREPAPTFPPTPPPDEPKVPIVEEPAEVLPPAPVVEEEEPELAEGVHALRGCAAVGGKFEYKVKIINNTEFVITNVIVSIVAFPEDCMEFSGERMKTIGRIEPDAFRSPQFNFTPTKDCVEGHIVATVSYMDYKNNLENVEIEPYVIRSVCDLLEPLESSLEEFEAMLFDMATNSEEIALDKRPDVAFSEALEFLPERNFELISKESSSDEGMFRGSVRGLAEGKYTKKKVAVSIVVSGQTADESATVRVEALGDDPDMLPTTIEEIIEGLKGASA